MLYDVKPGTSVRLAVIRLKDGFGNQRELDVRRGANQELVLQLASPGGGAESISNMQPRRPKPAFCGGTDAQTVDAVAAWARDSLYSVTAVERGPTAVQAPFKKGARA